MNAHEMAWHPGPNAQSWPSSAAGAHIPERASPRPTYQFATRFKGDSNAIESATLASLLVTVTLAGFLLFSDRFYHWFLIPIGICGVLIGTDAVAWLRGRLGLYDPVGIIGLFGFHFFFLAPLLHVEWDTFMPGANAPPDWRDWLGYMAILNVAGLICYRFCYKRFNIGSSSEPPKSYWRINQGTFRIIVPVCIAIAAATQIFLYARMGGIINFMKARQEDPTAFQGMGWVFMISESVPILTAFLIIFYFQQRKMSSSKIIGLLMVLFVVQIVFAGLRGSRSQTVQFLFWLVGCIHFFVRPVPRKLVYVGGAFLFIFLYFYAFYKAAGINGLNQAFSGSQERQQLAQKSGRTAGNVLLGDLGRSDVQAFILYRLLEDGREFTYAKGRTYLGALSMIIPHAILPEHPDSKLKEGTDIESGPGSYVAKVKWSSRVYGLAGESMLNFGPLSVPVFYAMLGLFLGWVRSLGARLLPGDARLLFMPLLIYQCFAILIGDSDNVVFGMIKDGFMPLLVITVCSLRLKRFSSYPLQHGLTARFSPSPQPAYGARTQLRMNQWNRS